ncbi:hypothetical protein JYT96_00365 [Gammaproteobacteria bacterium AH-315-C21]|nr:hypothetical protein [Gammaproteobacteria bacterium]MBN4078439.1 hypothetical protein [Gammaproteobacteria bacterium AH-315-C21]PCH62308.1 MAG: hypothetical protein COC09_08895 [Gammaproteobacteria bacterium]PCH64762.1 MAG: hypothetical protein COC09_00780 [Gammaproteobacteria bacterium]
MFVRSLSLLVMIGGFIAAPVFACSMAGEGNHVGKQVTAVDVEAGTFTIVDAQSNGPIQFSASKDLLVKVSEGPGPVLVSYEDRDGELVATDIAY